MSSQKQTLQIKLAKGINEFYDFCGYEITKSQIIELSKIIIDTWPGLTNEIFDTFVCRAKRGELGMIYKSPVSFMVAFNQFIKAYPIKIDLPATDPRRISDINEWRISDINR